MAWPCLQVLQAAGGPLTNKEVEIAVADALALTPAQRVLKKSKKGAGTRTMLDYKLAWSRTLLKNMGAVENVGPATWIVTERGRTATEADVQKETQDMIDRLQEGNKARAEARRAARDQVNPAK